MFGIFLWLVGGESRQCFLAVIMLMFIINTAIFVVLLVVANMTLVGLPRI